MFSYRLLLRDVSKNSSQDISEFQIPLAREKSKLSEKELRKFQEEQQTRDFDAV